MQGYEKLNNRLKISDVPIIYNHFECLRGICTKSGLIRSLRHYYDLNKEAVAAKYNVFDTTPTTYLVNMTKEDKSLN